MTTAEFRNEISDQNSGKSRTARDEPVQGSDGKHAEIEEEAGTLPAERPMKALSEYCSF